MLLLSCYCLASADSGGMDGRAEVPHRDLLRLISDISSGTRTVSPLSRADLAVRGSNTGNFSRSPALVPALGFHVPPRRNNPANLRTSTSSRQKAKDREQLDRASAISSSLRFEQRDSTNPTAAPCKEAPATPRLSVAPLKVDYAGPARLRAVHGRSDRHADLARFDITG